MTGLRWAKRIAGAPLLLYPGIHTGRKVSLHRSAIPKLMASSASCELAETSRGVNARERRSPRRSGQNWLGPSDDQSPAECVSDGVLCAQRSSRFVNRRRRLNQQAEISVLQDSKARGVDA